MATIAAPSHPLIQFRARFDGYLQWICPHCQTLNAGNRTKVNFRRPQAACYYCNRRYVLGFHLEKPSTNAPRLNAVYVETPSRYTTHVVGAAPAGIYTFGRALGTFWWVCSCRKLQKASLTTKSTLISCPHCKLCYTVGVVLYKSVKGRAKPLPTPLDWVLPVWDLA